MPDGEGIQAHILRKLDDLQADMSGARTEVAVANTKLDTLVAHKDDHEARLRALERWKYGLPIAALLSAGSIALGVLSYVRH